MRCHCWPRTSCSSTFSTACERDAGIQTKHLKGKNSLTTKCSTFSEATSENTLRGPPSFSSQRPTSTALAATRPSPCLRECAPHSLCPGGAPLPAHTEHKGCCTATPPRRGHPHCWEQTEAHSVQSLPRFLAWFFILPSPWSQEGDDRVRLCPGCQIAVSWSSKSLSCLLRRFPNKHQQ